MAIRILTAVLLALASCGPAAMARDLWIEGVTIVSAERAAAAGRHASVRIHDGRIAEISRAPLQGAPG